MVAAYNEHDRVYGAALAILEAAGSLGRGHEIEIVLVDDGSADGTWGEMVRFVDDFKGDVAVSCFRLSSNRGVGNAFRYGVERLTSQSVTLIPGDGAFTVRTIGRLIAELPSTGIVVGHRGTRHSKHLVRRSLSRGLGIWFKWLTRSSVSDPHGIFAIPTSLVRSSCDLLWGAWDESDSSRLDNRYHIQLLKVCLESCHVGAIVDVETEAELEQRTQIFRVAFLAAFLLLVAQLTFQHLSRRPSNQPEMAS